LAILLVLTVTMSSLIMLESVNAATKPSIPQFTLKFVKHIFDSPPVPSTDPFTGKQTTLEGTHLEWLTLDLSSTNQQFTGTGKTGYAQSYTGIMYKIRFKGYYSQDWKNLTTFNCEGTAGPYFAQDSAKSNTVISLLLFDGVSVDQITRYAPQSRPDSGVTITSGGEADFQVEAMSGTVYVNHVLPFSPWVFEGDESGWTNTQTITYNEADVTTVYVSPTPTTNSPLTPMPTGTTPTPTQTTPSPQGSQTGFGLSWEQTAIVVLAVVVAAMSVTIGVLLIKERHRRMPENAGK
jgi:hypothetical protein